MITAITPSNIVSGATSRRRAIRIPVLLGQAALSEI
jgi:hypothetical protein